MQQCIVFQAQKSEVPCNAHNLQLRAETNSQTAVMSCSTICAALHGQSTVLQGTHVQGRRLFVDILLMACCKVLPRTGTAQSGLEVDIG